MLEYSDESGTKQNISSINLNLGASRWNITRLELNFTDIKLERETVTIEEGYHDTKEISEAKAENAWGVQVNITEPTLLFGVYIYGYYVLKDGTPPSEEVTVEIRGFDDVDNRANDTIYTSTLLNMGDYPGSESWFYQNFSKPPLLNEGQYYLVINGSKLINDKTKYFWVFNDHATNPNLHICKYTDEWKNGESGKAFRYKLVQRVNRSFSPKTLNLTAEINGNLHSISNGPKIGTGNLTLSILNFFPNVDNLYIPITHNQTFNIFFNLSYNICLENNFASNGAVVVNENPVNDWNITHLIDKCTNNYSIKFYYPKSWNIVNVTIDGQNITDKIIIDLMNYFIFLTNNTLINNSQITIFATSPNIQFELTTLKSEFKINEFLNFTIYPPNSEDNNNITYILIDEDGFEINKETVINPEGPINISYQIALYPHPGSWKILIFWNNGTDAGIRSQIVIITTLLTTTIISSGNDNEDSYNEFLILNQSDIISVGLIAAISIISSLTIYTQIKRIKRIHKEKAQTILRRYRDILNLQTIEICDKKTGLSVYQLNFTEKDINSQLLSGYIEAIRVFGIQFLSTGEESPIVKIEFQNSKLLYLEYLNFRIIFLITEIPSSEFLVLIQQLSEKIEQKYGKKFQEYNGDLTGFVSLKDLIDKNLDTIFLYPMKINNQDVDINMTSSEKSLFYRVLNYVKKNKLDHFYAKNLLPPNDCDYKEIEIFHNLVDKKIFQIIE